MIGLGINFNGKHSYKDFGLHLKQKSIGEPIPNYITDSVPFMQGTYDFSELYGDITYSERVISYTFDIIDYTKQNMNGLKIAVLNWLKGSQKKILSDDSILGYYFLAQASDYEFSENGLIGTLTVKFNCYPFKMGSELEGERLWDSFNFEVDTAQITKFNINKFKKIALYNVSACKITPTIIADDTFLITKGTETYEIQKGTTKDYRFKLDEGMNILTISGSSGNISFEFRQEVL